MIMEPVDGFLGKDDVPETAALSEQLVKTQDQTTIISEGERLFCPVLILVLMLVPMCGSSWCWWW